MSARARELAERFERTSEEFAREVEHYSEEQWRAICPDEGRTVAAMVRHVAWAFDFELATFQAIAEDRPLPPYTQESIDEANAANGSEYAACDQSESVQLLRRNAADSAVIVAALTAEQLARSGLFIEGIEALTVDEWIEYVLIGHIEGHLPGIRAAASA